MHRAFIAFAATLAALAMVALTADLGSAQQPLPSPPIGFQPPPPPPPAPVKPYVPVPVTLPASLSDPSFVAFRKSLADIAQHKDRAALAKLIVAKGFFWVQDKDLADPSKPGIDNLAKAIDLDAQGGSGWEIVADAAVEPTAADAPQHKGIFCAPALPTFDPQAFAELVQATDATEWGYPTTNGVEVRAAAQPNAQVVDKLGLYIVRVLPDSTPTDSGGAPAFLHVALPNGKTGFVATASIGPLANDQICYAKDAGSWKITGYVGGVQQ
jgi:hypothetical protein